VILAGGDGLALHVVRRLRRRGHDVILLVGSRDEADRAVGRFDDILVVVGAATDASVLESVEARSCDLFVALCDTDPESLLACLLARRFFGVPRTVALVQDPDNGDLFRSLGVDSVVSSAEILGGVIEGESGFDGIAMRMALAGGRVGVVELRLGRDAPAVGRTLEQLELPVGALVATVLRDDAVIVPRGRAALCAGDRLLVVSESSVTALALQRLVGDR
jgi:trk system potassium uptake protein TrkA